MLVEPSDRCRSYARRETAAAEAEKFFNQFGEGFYRAVGWIVVPHGQRWTLIVFLPSGMFSYARQIAEKGWMVLG